MTKELFRFKTDDESLIKWIREQKEFSSFAIDVLNQVRTGELLPASEVLDVKELDLNYKKLRNKNLTKKNLNLDIKNRISLVSELKYSPIEAAEIARGEKSIDEDERIICFESGCNWKLDYKPNDVSIEVNHLIQHLKDAHQRTPTEKEQEKLLELTA